MKAALSFLDNPTPPFSRRGRRRRIAVKMKRRRIGITVRTTVRTLAISVRCSKKMKQNSSAIFLCYLFFSCTIFVFCNDFYLGNQEGEFSDSSREASLTMPMFVLLPLGLFPRAFHQI